MKGYLVFMSGLSLAPLQGQNPLGGKIKKFDELAPAQIFAQGQKDKWDLVFVLKRITDVDFEKIEQYQNGRRYVVDETN